MTEVNVLDVKLKVSVRDDGVDGEGHWTHLVAKSGTNLLLITDIIIIKLRLLSVMFEINKGITITGLENCLNFF